MSELQDLVHQVSQCTDCQLHQNRTRAVPGEGDPQADIMFIGEGPGLHEDQQGRPFVGAAGKFLDELLESIGLDRSMVYITNMIKCRPPNNRDPFPGEIQECSKYLDHQIELIKPRVVVTLGRHSLAKFFPRESVSKARGKARSWNGVTVYPLLHPAAALYRRDLRETIERDFQAIPELVKGVQSRAGPQGEDGDNPQQLSMF